MTCEAVATRIDDYVDGLLDEAEFQEVELHVAGCAGCRQQERELRALLAEAATLPRHMEPARDLWPDIAARLRSAEGERGVVRPLVARWMRPMTLAAAAAVLVAVSAAVWTRGRAPMPSPSAASGTVREVAAGPAPADLLEAEQEYARATATLLAALDHQKETLPPEARAALEGNLKTIDDALAEVRTALRKDPGNALLAHLLTSTHQKKLDALQRVVRLSRT